jgi:hypothetical protein
MEQMDTYKDKNLLGGRGGGGVGGREGREGTRMAGRQRRRREGGERVVNTVCLHVCGDIGRRIAAQT